VLVLSFFRDNGQAGIYLAASDDGLKFTALNGDQPVMKPANWPNQNLTRDPSIVFRDGKFHAVWTSNWKGQCFGCAESTDLIHWSEPVKVQPFPETLAKEDQPRNVWAPEICWDPAQKNYAIIWSSTIERESRNGDGSSMDGKDGALDHRIFISRTADGKTFSDAKVFFDPKFCCIDGMMALDESAGAGRWVMIFKNEQETRLGGKNLRMVTAPADFSKPWSEVSAPIAGPGSPVRGKEMAEGPSLLRWKDQWYLYWDAFANGHYCVASSTDLKTWTDRTAELQMPPHPSHGSPVKKRYDEPQTPAQRLEVCGRGDVSARRGGGSGTSRRG
jgi:beta-xylosidase